MNVGTRVGAERWPYSAAHPDCWGQPWAGVVLAKDDPRAWADTLAFRGTPTVEQVREHLARVGGIPSFVPVLWEFGPDGSRCYWEPVASLRTYAEDVAEWKAAKTAAKAQTRGLKLVAA